MLGRLLLKYFELTDLDFRQHPVVLQESGRHEALDFLESRYVLSLQFLQQPPQLGFLIELRIVDQVGVGLAPNAHIVGVVYDELLQQLLECVVLSVVSEHLRDEFFDIESAFDRCDVFEGGCFGQLV